MTIKYPDCPQLTKYSPVEYKVPCSCPYGTSYKEYLNSKNRPEYENPFLLMTDEEILNILDESSKDQRAIDQEFE